ncbi:hypothetical protein EQG49_04845 [Periweissella cryptocerci]|uniref:Tetratricopeptide repeat protein n=1 Tax=Periweissella cryptocerci TaxID=2506420 RepID=A0A4P6YSX0_9LACO|nr:hypothetical protein [Periweissella cryptocerci]QBO35839.1 hypothetical protein EQG49_04845 [Periweissella cryptocerci]
MQANDFKKLIQEDFDEAIEIAIKMDNVELIEMLNKSVDLDNSVSMLFFVEELIEKKETAELHAAAMGIVTFSLSEESGAYQVGLRHIRKAIALEPNNLHYKEDLLYFYELPEMLVSLNEATAVAREVIQGNPNNKTAGALIKYADSGEKGDTETNGKKSKFFGLF